jgi:hypothetical protein
MAIISKKTWQTIKDSFQTFVIDGFMFAFAISLTFVEERFGFRAGDGLDDAEEALRVGAV